MKFEKDQLRYIARPEIVDTFVDSIRMTTFDGATLRIEFCITRVYKLEHGKPPKGSQYTACRLVLTADAAGELHNQLQNISNAIQTAKQKETKTPH